jgi:hypothetical protein
MIDCCSRESVCVVVSLPIKKRCQIRTSCQMGGGGSKPKPITCMFPSPHSVPEFLNILLEAENSTFQGQPSFQRSEVQQGSQLLHFFVLFLKNFSVNF